MKKIYYNHELWEEYHAGMWKIIRGEKRDQLLKKAIEFTGNAGLYGEYMLKALDLWPISCDQNLSDVSINRQAWIGHAACCIAIECPEDITREAWHYLTDNQQISANIMADKAIREWERRNKLKEANRQSKLF